MARHVICPADEVGPGQRRLVEVAGRPIVIFNIAGDYFALANRCPHQGGSLFHGDLTSRLTAPEPGRLALSSSDPVVKCPWHGWEFDVRTGKAVCEPQRIATRRYSASILSGAELVDCAGDVESIPVDREGDYLVVEF